MVEKKEEIEKMINCGGYKNPLGFFEWAHSYADINLDKNNNVAFPDFCLTVCDEIAKLEDSDKIFRGIITQAKFMGIESEVATESPRYKALLCLLQFLEG